MTTTTAVSYEGLVLGAKAGIDPEALYEVVLTASGRSRAWERNVPRALSRDFGNEGSLYALVRDQDAAHALSEALGVPMPVFEAARPQLKQAADSLGDVDPSTAVTVVEKAAGFDVRAT